MRKMGSAFWHYFRAVAWGDWRGRLVIISFLLSGIATVIVWLCVPSATDVKTFFGAAFASWVSAYLLFIITGLIIAIVTLARPDQELFEARARNLLQRQTGPHINYIVSKLHDLFEPYLQDVNRNLTVIDYDQVNGLFLVNQETELVYKSYLVDIPVTFDSRIGYMNGTPAPEGRQKCCLTHLKVGGKPVGDAEEFEDQIIRPFKMQVLPQSPVSVHYRIAVWVRAGEEPNRQRVRRFTRNIRVTLHNQLATRAINVVHPQEPDLDRTVQPGEVAQIINLKEIRPAHDDGEFAYDFRLSVP